MDSDSDEENVHYGTPLEPIEEDVVSKRRPPAPEDQTVRDAQGRQRFHGAFTGGFSAGFFNTVGSEEGFKPSSFVSSRSSRAEKRQAATARDFMDDEDLAEHGIAPQRIQARSEFSDPPTDGSSSQRRRYPQYNEAPIPGQPVLEQLIEPVRDTVGVRILKSMGWKPGQGIGPRITRKEKKQQQKVYGCAGPPGPDPDPDPDSEDEDLWLRDQLLAPDDFQCPAVRPKDDLFGLGYRGLERRAVLGPTGGDPTLRYRDKAGKLAIRGQAFGVGAFEEDDEDIYTTEDMSNYDFSEGAPAPSSSSAPRPSVPGTLPGFLPASRAPPPRPRYPPPPLPPRFQPVHKPRVSRFEPLPEQQRGLERHRLSAEQRSQLIGEPAETSSAAPPPADISSVAPPAAGVASVASPIVQTFSSVTHVTDPEVDSRLAEVRRLVTSEPTGDVTSSQQQQQPELRPFSADPDKQSRYEQFTKLLAAGRKDDYRLLQPTGMTSWEREREVSEFQRAALIFRPLSGCLASRFVSAGTSDRLPAESAGPAESASGGDAGRLAAKQGRYGQLTRTADEWHPHQLLCKRFNVKNPYPDSSIVGSLSRTLPAGLGLALAESPTAAQPSLPAPAQASLPASAQPSLPDPAQLSLPAPRARLRWDQLPEPEQHHQESVAGTVSQPAASQGVQLFGLSSESAAPAETAPQTKPSMDLFRAIFDDSDAELDQEEPSQPAAGEPNQPAAQSQPAPEIPSATAPVVSGPDRSGDTSQLSAVGDKSGSGDRGTIGPPPRPVRMSAAEFFSDGPRPGGSPEPPATSTAPVVTSTSTAPVVTSTSTAPVVTAPAPPASSCTPLATSTAPVVTSPAPPASSCTPLATSTAPVVAPTSPVVTSTSSRPVGRRGGFSLFDNVDLDQLNSWQRSLDPPSRLIDPPNPPVVLPLPDGDQYGPRLPERPLGGATVAPAPAKRRRDSSSDSDFRWEEKTSSNNPGRKEKKKRRKSEKKVKKRRKRKSSSDDSDSDTGKKLLKKLKKLTKKKKRSERT